MKTFSNALREAVKTGTPSLRAIHKKTGVSYEQLKKINQRVTEKTNVEDARKIAAFFGKTIEEFIGCPEMSDDIETASILAQLTPEERRFLLNAAKAQIEDRESQPSEDQENESSEDEAE